MPSDEADPDEQIIQAVAQFHLAAQVVAHAQIQHEREENDQTEKTLNEAVDELDGAVDYVVELVREGIEGLPDA